MVFLEFSFLITFTTNIAMHIFGGLAETVRYPDTYWYFFRRSDSDRTGSCISYQKDRKYTLPTAMLSFCAGGILMILFPRNLAMLIAALSSAVSSGGFYTDCHVEVADLVRPAAAAMGSMLYLRHVYGTACLAGHIE